jgi:hypothetical protein
LDRSSARADIGCACGNPYRLGAVTDFRLSLKTDPLRPRLLELPCGGERSLDTGATTGARRISKECLLALAALIFYCSRDCFLFDEQSRRADYDGLTALPPSGPDFGVE